jgi:hypothetical protein
VTGGEGQNRTVDTTIFSRMLYQLSYLATRGPRAQGKTAIIACEIARALALARPGTRQLDAHPRPSHPGQAPTA